MYIQWLELMTSASEEGFFLYCINYTSKNISIHFQVECWTQTDKVSQYNTVFLKRI